MVGKYRKKPVEIEAVKFDGRNYKEIDEFMNFSKKLSGDTGRSLIISTLEGDMLAGVGDFIIKGVQGEFYPCKPDIFELTYESI